MTTPDPRMRAADADRQAAVDRLSGHFTAGRLTPTEYDDRIQQAYASTYLDELSTLFTDLPSESGRGDSGFAGRDADHDSWQEPMAGSASGWPGGSQGWSGRSAAGQWSRSVGRGSWSGPAGRPWRSHGGVPRIGVVIAIIAIVVLATATRGFFLIPLVWFGLAMLLFGRRRGGCGRRAHGPHSAP